ncbi:MAG TPA: AraC family transcriptional regulator [Methylophaga aminisulfidivorans]|uniref:AraC family transcriptional regulator n=1 Tax=Methylophaga aminisulfidivorans TaxID=230105 RepID=A0A7C2AB31_9GAMM|nr:AraC family transcriptional regulator [Methylophaga aminisulfidivorans]
MAKLLKHTGYERDVAFIPAYCQPAVLIDLAIARDVNTKHLFRSTRLSLDDLHSADTLVSSEQVETLIDNTRKLLDADDTSFLYGQQLLPGFYGACSHALQQVRSARQAIEFLCEFHVFLTPLMTPRFYENDEYGFLYWQTNSGSTQIETFLSEAYISATKSMIDWLSKQSLPWQFEFTHAEPEYIEQYWVNLGSDVLFEQQMNVMKLPLSYLNKEWSASTSLGLHGATNAAYQQLRKLDEQASFLDHLYDYLRQHITEPISLDSVSFAFGISPASMKRKLKKHHTHFQQQLDLVRKHTAIYLYQVKGFSNQDIAEYLCFSDMNNFRRAFKRWTGLSPNTLFAQ